MDIFAIIGSVSGLISIVGLVYLLGVWKGSVDSKLRDITQQISQYPPGETSLMAKTLWDIYVVDALRNRPDLAEHHSSYKLRREGEDLIPDDIKQELNQVPHNEQNKDAIASGWLVVKHLGMEAISRVADEKGLSIQEAIAILSTYLENNMEV